MTELGNPPDRSAILNSLDRAAILSRFETLLDSALTSETPPSGIDAEILASVLAESGAPEDRRTDAYAMWSAITALTQEVKLEGRAFQELNRALAGQTEKVAEELRALYAERERAAQRETERRVRKESLGALIDLRDRLGRGLESVQARAREREKTVPQKKPWWSRLFGERAAAGDPQDVKADIAAIVRGYELGIERLDQSLSDYHARPIRCKGETFDPRRMNAIESVESDTVPAGTVVEVFLSGYEWNGEVFRPAQVKVSRGSGRPPYDITETQ